MLLINEAYRLCLFILLYMKLYSFIFVIFYGYMYMKIYIFLFFCFFASHLFSDSLSISYNGDKKNFFLVKDKQFIIPVLIVKGNVKNYTSVPQKYKLIKGVVFEK